LYLARPKPRHIQSRRETLVPAKAKQSVIVVDNDASTLRALERLLRAFEFEVILFRNAEAILDESLPFE